MKKLLLITAILSVVFLFSGCGQEMDVTIYNTSGVTYSGIGDQTYIQITADISNLDGTNITFFPSGVALTDSECDATNSYTITGKENETLHLYAKGYRYNVDSSGNTTLVDFYVDPVNKILYGSFLEAPRWYAAVFTNSIVIYKK